MPNGDFRLLLTSTDSSRRQAPSTYNTMSAPNAGRQSPEPKHQAGSQGNDPIAGNPNQQGAKSDSQESSNDTLKGLESNPKHILEDASKEKTKKG